MGAGRIYRLHTKAPPNRLAHVLTGRGGGAAPAPGHRGVYGSMKSHLSTLQLDLSLALATLAGGAQWVSVHRI